MSGRAACVRWDRGIMTGMTAVCRMPYRKARATCPGFVARASGQRSCGGGQCSSSAWWRASSFWWHCFGRAAVRKNVSRLAGGFGAGEACESSPLLSAIPVRCCAGGVATAGRRRDAGDAGAHQGIAFHLALLSDRAGPLSCSNWQLQRDLCLAFPFAADERVRAFCVGREMLGGFSPLPRQPSAQPAGVAEGVTAGWRRAWKIAKARG